MLPGHCPVLHPRSEGELVCAVAALEAHGIRGFVENAQFGALFRGPLVPHYNERAVLVPVEQEATARLVLAGVEGRRRLFRPRPSVLDRLRVVVECGLAGWFVPGSSARLRPLRALGLSLAAGLLLWIAVVILLLALTYLQHRWKVVNAKGKIGASSSSHTGQRANGLGTASVAAGRSRAPSTAPAAMLR